MFGESGYPKQTPPLTLDKSVKNRRFIKYAKHDDAISSSALKSEIGNHILRNILWGKSMPWGMLRSVRTPNIGMNSQKI